MPPETGAPLGWSLAAFALATVVIALAGTRLAGIADRLADRTGLGEAVVGAVLLGASTSLSGVVTSVTMAAGGHAELAVSHAIGGIAIQTAFLAVGDILYREANLEHAAASPANMMQAALLVTLLAFVLIGVFGPGVTVGSVDVVSVLIVAAYAFGIRLVHRAQKEPLWEATRTRSTRRDEPAAGAEHDSLRRLALQFAALAALVAAAGWVIGTAAASIAQHTGLSATVIGGLFATASTSLPELVTTIAAVRRGALTLAVGAVLGGNVFDTLLVALSDVAYRDGSVYLAAGGEQVVLLALAILLTGVILLGLLRREERGIANIGFESVLVLVLYAAGVLLVAFS